MNQQSAPSARMFPVEHEVDVFTSRRSVGEMARTLGFRERECHELVLVASELGSNILKYGKGGGINLDIVEDPTHGLGLRIVAFDRGPPFFDLANALKDGYDDRGELSPDALVRRRGTASGLGAVVRLSDSFYVETFEGGKRLCVVRYLRSSKKQTPSWK